MVDPQRLQFNCPYISPLITGLDAMQRRYFSCIHAMPRLMSAKTISRIFSGV